MDHKQQNTMTQYRLPLSRWKTISTKAADDQSYFENSYETIPEFALAQTWL